MGRRRGELVKIVDILEAKADLARLVEEEFIIARGGRPVARVVPIPTGNATARIGFRQEISVPDDFDEMGADTIGEMFRGR